MFEQPVRCPSCGSRHLFLASGGKNRRVCLRAAKMKSASLLALGRALAVAVGAMACASCSQQLEKLETIPLAEIYATQPNDGMKRLVLVNELPFDGDRLEWFLKLRPRASNLYLATANNLKEAAEAAIRFDGRPNLTFPADDKVDVWLVVFFGFAHTNPVRWTIESIQVTEAKIRVNFASPEIVQRTQDFEPYFVLAPLKNFKAGTYELQLHDSTSKETTLSRKVRVEGARR